MFFKQNPMSATLFTPYQQAILLHLGILLVCLVHRHSRW